MPPVGNTNFAWVQHFLYHLAPRGIAGFVLANGSMSSNQSGEGEIRKNITEAGLVDCIIALPGQLFRSTQIPAAATVVIALFVTYPFVSPLYRPGLNGPKSTAHAYLSFPLLLSPSNESS